jgi:hypothetical protein
MKVSFLSGIFAVVLIFITSSSWSQSPAQTTALWLFDEQVGLYPSAVLSDQSDNDYAMVIGPGGQIVPGKFGNALEPIEQPEVNYPEGEERFGLKPVPVSEGRTVAPMTWMNANFCALMTSGEHHLRNEVGFVNATDAKLNLGNFDWTVEFWFQPTRNTGQEGVVFEIGQGPRGENNHVTSLSLNIEMNTFVLINQPSASEISLSTARQISETNSPGWSHLAFVYSTDKKELKHYLNGKLQSVSQDVELKTLDYGDEAYLSVGRDGMWNRPLQGKIDELRFSVGLVYSEEFDIPESFSPIHAGDYQPVGLKKGPPLLFDNSKSGKLPIQLDDRKHLFIDDAIVAEMEHVTFKVNPPRLAERVIEGIEGPFRKHLTIVEDENGLIRVYNSIHDDLLAVRTSEDGIHWKIPDLGRGEYKGQYNIVLPEMVGGLGNPFIDPNGPSDQRWKFITGYHRRAIFVYTSPDGWHWTRHKTALLPFRSGTQSCSFYDDQRQLYVSYHRTGINRTVAGATQRESVLTETKDLFQPIPYTPVTMDDYAKAAKTMRLRDPLPWYLDNGPLTPGGFGIEFPHKFAPIDTLDPPEIDFYITKAQKYPWAPDTYLAFPIAYFHYEVDTPLTRLIHMDPRRGRGSGPIETQLSVSRDGVIWKRYPRPAYVGNGLHQDWPVNQAYLAHGMVRRGDEIWQYYFGTEIYHSTYSKDKSKNAVYRVVQRLDGFVSADTPYEKDGFLKTKPLVFKGNRMVLNIDTDAMGYAQVGLLDDKGNPIEGFAVEECIYINGDFIETEVEWLKKGKDVAELEGKTIQILFKMRGSKLYAMQFVNKSEGKEEGKDAAK